MAYTLEIGSASPATLGALGISEATLSENVLGEAALELKAPSGLNEAAIIAPFQKCILRDTSNTIRFIGWLDTAPRRAEGRSASVTYTLSGPQRWLQRQYYSQGRAGFVILGGTAGSGTTTAAQAFSAAYYSAVSGLGAITTQTEAEVAAIFPHTIPNRFRSDVTVYDAVSSLLAFAPTAVLRWSYPSTTPKLELARVDTTIDAYLDGSVHKIISAGLNPRYDMLADSIVVYFVRGDSVVGSSTYGPQYGKGLGGDAGAFGANRLVVQTYDCSVINNLPSSGIAQVLAPWHQRLHIDGEVKKQGIDWSDRAGQLLGFTGSTFANFLSWSTLCSEITRDLFSETTTLKLGVLPQKNVYKIGDYDTGVAPSAQTHAATPFSLPSSGVNFQDGAKQTNVSPDGVNTTGDVNADGDVDCNNLRCNYLNDAGSADIGANLNVGGNANVAGNAQATGSLIGAYLSTSGSADIGANMSVAGNFTLLGSFTVGTNSFSVIEIERCDGKKMKVLGTGWA